MDSPSLISQNQDRRPPLRCEITLFDVLRFLRDSYKIICIAVIIGLAATIFYVAITPPKYEAIAQIAIAQISAPNNNLNSPVISIEEPSLLIARFSQPTSFTTRVVDACKVDDGGPNPGAKLAESIKLTQPKGVANVVELKTYGATPRDAQFCAQAIFELIKATQTQIVAPYIEDLNVKLLGYEDRLQRAKELVARADKASSAMGAVYLSTRDEIRFLLEEIATLKNIVAINQSKATRLIAPIYARDTPIAPKKWAVLAGGLLSGLILGLLVALVRKIFVMLKNDQGGLIW